MSFLGAWLVSEYVYNADGSFAGVVRQRRQLQRLANGNVQVWQWPEPGPELAGHPMSEFTGERVFELQVDGRARRYLGPEVIGTGLAWGEGAMTGRGVWPRFGHNFTSFSVMPNPAKQVTGGKFFNASEIVANIIGLAIPETEGATWPEFAGPHWPGEASEQWIGTCRRVGGDGAVQSEQPVTRRYTATGWQDDEGNALTLDGRRASGLVEGIFKRLGWALEIEAVASPAQTVSALEILAGPDLIGLWTRRMDDMIEHVEVLHLRPR